MAAPGVTAETPSSGPVRVRRSSDGRVVCDRMSFASSLPQRMRGLIGRDALDDGDGLYIATSSIHMMFMRFPIDALFLGAPDASGTRRVVATRSDLPPWRGVVLPVRGAQAVVELPAGTLRRHDVRRDDLVTFEATASPAEAEESAA